MVVSEAADSGSIPDGRTSRKTADFKLPHSPQSCSLEFRLSISPSTQESQPCRSSQHLAMLGKGTRNKKNENSRLVKLLFLWYL
jgi:hypothetical protein